MSPARLPRPANDTSLAASFNAATRRGDVIGEMLRAAHGRVGVSRGSKARDTVDPATQAATLRRERCAAFFAGLIEAAEHGVGDDSRLLAAFGDLLPTLDADVRPWAQKRVNYLLRKPRNRPVPMGDVPQLKARLAALRSDDAAESGPPSGPRMLLAADRRYVALRREAMDALSALVGDYGAGCYQIGGKQLPADAARELGDMMRELDVEVMHPSRGNVPRMAREAASIAATIGKQVAGMQAAGERAAAALGRLTAFVEQGGGR